MGKILGLSRDTVACIKPPVLEPIFDRITSSVRNHKGEPFNPIDYPWTRGICEAWDDPEVRSITLQFSARIGKTQLAQSLIVAAISREPATAMYANATQELVKETARDKYFPMFERCSHTRKWVPPPSKRNATRIDLATCRIYCAWSGSPVTLADKDPKYLHGGEIDKWSKSKSTEADPLELFLERGLEIPDRKVIIESTPSIKNQSRVERYLERGWNCRWHVPCPLCGHFQELIVGTGEPGTGGVIFDKKDGRLDELTAYQTARYRCEKCLKEWDDNDRRPAIKRGVWVPAGQFATRTGKLRGSMLNPGPNASYQLSRIYAPTFSFGDMAAAFVKSYIGSEEEMRNFRNSWLGLTWQPVSMTRKWEEVAALLCLDYKLNTVPKDVNFITVGVDVQVDHWVYKVVGWGAYSRGFVIDYGIKESWDEIRALIQTSYAHSDGGPRIAPVLTLIDARDGNRTDEVVGFCKSINQEATGPWVWPCMGSSAGQMSGQSYRKSSNSGKNKRGQAISKRKRLDFGWVTVNTNYWQQWMHNCLFKRKAGEPMSIAYPDSSRTDQDLWEQMMNEAPDVGTDTTGHDKVKWVVVQTHIPVDLRDATRYARCAAEVVVRGNWTRVPDQRRYKPPVKAMSRTATEQPTTKQQTATIRRRVRKLTGSRLGRRK